MSDLEPVLVTGGTGFIASAVIRELLRVREATRSAPALRVLARRPLPEWMPAAGVERIAGDLSVPVTLRGCCDGVGTVLHLASYVGRDAATCRAVNETGTGALVYQARAAGVRRVLYVSTASVYGDGIHRGAPEGSLTLAPVSVASASRLAAESAVLGCGGIVLRPHLVYGPGDRWVIPGVVRLAEAVPAWSDGGLALSSLIAVEDLARVVAALAGTAWSAGEGVYHVNQPAPVRMRDLVELVSRLLGCPLPHGDIPGAEHWTLASSALPELTRHQHSLLAQDHWYDSHRIWARLGLDPGPGIAARLAAAAPWYREHLASRR